MLGRAAFLALILLLSTAGASWQALGGLEPSTEDDFDAGLMFEDPDTSDDTPGVYFQAFQSVEQLTLNPNVAATHGRFLAPGPVHHRALLGFWKDCNDDGYVGLAESALLDYHATLLLDTSVCPTDTQFNDGQWVSEMIGIGMVDPCERGTDAHREENCGGLAVYHENERAFYADGTMVWGDIGAPGSVPPAECPLVPLPPATTSSSGMLLAYADCQDDRRIASSVNDVDADGSLGLRFEDAEHPERSTSLLNQAFPVTLFGGPNGPGALEAGSSRRAATVWDCSKPREMDVQDPSGGGLDEVVLTDPSGGRLTGPQPAIPVVGVVTPFYDEDGTAGTPGVRRVKIADDGSLLWVPSAAPAPEDARGSWWDAGEAALDGPRGDCNDGTTSPLRPASPGAIVEGGNAQVDAGHKNRASFVFTWYDGHRGLREGSDQMLLGPAAPSDGGLAVRRHDRGGVGPMWNATAASVNEPQLLSRGSLGPTPPQTWTYYAKLGDAVEAAALRIPAGGAGGLYGSEACGSETSGVHNGWVCDPALWWRDALARDVRPRYAEGNVSYAPVPGERYHMRDVDCYDGHVAAGVFASLVAASGSACG